MNYSAIANRIMNATVRVCLVPVSSLDEPEEQELHVGRDSGIFGGLPREHRTRPDLRGGAMALLELSAHMTVRPGCLEGFKRQAAELIRITRERDTRTLRYDWFLSLDGTECEVREAYTGPEGLIEHNSNILEARAALFRDYADSHFMTVYGEVSEPLLNLLKTHSVGHKWFSFLQGLEPSAAIPPQILVAAREATQPV